MTVRERIALERLLALLEQDRDVIDALVEAGLLPADRGDFLPEEVELACVARTLVRDLEVNWAGVEVILRLRGELLDTRRQVAALLELLGERWRGADR